MPDERVETLDDVRDRLHRDHPDDVDVLTNWSLLMLYEPDLLKVRIIPGPDGQTRIVMPEAWEAFMCALLNLQARTKDVARDEWESHADPGSLDEPPYEPPPFDDTWDEVEETGLKLAAALFINVRIAEHVVYNIDALALDEGNDGLMLKFKEGDLRDLAILKREAP